MPQIFGFLQKDETMPRCWLQLAEHKLPAAQAAPVSASPLVPDRRHGTQV